MKEIKQMKLNAYIEFNIGTHYIYFSLQYKFKLVPNLKNKNKNKK